MRGRRTLRLVSRRLATPARRPKPRKIFWPSVSVSETTVREDLVVVKRDGRHEAFEPEKLQRAIRAACHKRPVDLEQINMMVEDLVDALEAQFDREIPSSAIGEACMQRLKVIDKVAYVRFASVYKEFRDVAEFVEELNKLARSK
jgi:transcriptional repressor NrdR